MENHSFSAADHETWKRLFDRQTPLRTRQMIPNFLEGLNILGITNERIPDLEKVNQKLKSLTGWRAVYVKGLENAESFYSMLSKKEFPIGHFIRSSEDLNYTPEPDVFHDLYGHIPFYANSKYAEACEAFGKKACQFIEENKPHLLRQFERFFWFTYEFGLVETLEGRRIFGGGIASSFSECAYSLSNEPEVLPFDIDQIRKQEFDISHIQKRIFVFESVDQLYHSLDELYEHVLHDSEPEEFFPSVN